MKRSNEWPWRRALAAAVFLVAGASPAVSQGGLCPPGDTGVLLGLRRETAGTLLRTRVPRDRPREPLRLEDLVDLSALNGLRVDLVGRLPPGKTGVTTGEGPAVRILISRQYPLFVQYSSLVHELVHVRHRQQGLHRQLSRDQRELQAFAAELAPENVQVLRSFACPMGKPGEGMLRAFLDDVATHYWHHRLRVARNTGLENAGEMRDCPPRGCI